jgi:hypothetical protein
MFRFLDLPAGTRSIPRCKSHNTNWSPELRNRIYDFAAIPTRTDQERCVLPALSLAHTCRQTRTEYLPICKTAPATILWRDVPSYFRTFYQHADGKMTDIAQAPTSITILVGCHDPELDGLIDLLPLLRMKHANAAFSCHFDYRADDPAEESDEANDRREFLKADVDMLDALLHHDYPQWVDDLKTGRISKVNINDIGLTTAPSFNISIHD